MKSLIATICILGLVGLVVGVAAQGAETAPVTATVAVQNISVTVTDGTVTYGTLAASASKDTTSGGLNDTQIATNNGNITEDLNIRGQNSSPAGWVLAASAGPSQYAHKFCKTGTGAPDPCDATPTWTPLTTSNQTLTASVAAGNTQRFDLQILVPSSSSDYTQQSVDVTVVATAS